MYFFCMKSFGIHTRRYIKYSMYTYATNVMRKAVLLAIHLSTGNNIIASGIMTRQNNRSIYSVIWFFSCL